MMLQEAALLFLSTPYVFPALSALITDFQRVTVHFGPKYLHLMLHCFPALIARRETFVPRCGTFIPRCGILRKAALFV
jgi:hypothetical protein